MEHHSPAAPTPKTPRPTPPIRPEPDQAIEHLTLQLMRQHNRSGEAWILNTYQVRRKPPLPPADAHALTPPTQPTAHPAPANHLLTRCGAALGVLARPLPPGDAPRPAPASRPHPGASATSHPNLTLKPPKNLY